MTVPYLRSQEWECLEMWYEEWMEQVYGLLYLFQVVSSRSLGARVTIVASLSLSLVSVPMLVE